jgi:hypothetical protein
MQRNFEKAHLFWMAATENHFTRIGEERGYMLFFLSQSFFIAKNCSKHNLLVLFIHLHIFPEASDFLMHFYEIIY